MNKSGFTFIEILVVILIIGLMATFVVPRFTGRSIKYEQENLVGKLNTLVQLGVQNALMTSKIQRILFDMDKNLIQLESQEGKNSQGESKFAPVKIPYLKNNIALGRFEIKNFYLKKEDQMGGFGKTRKHGF